MQRLLENISRLSEIQELCTSIESPYYEHTCINNREITKNTISVIMTSSNRSNQVYYTFFTFLHSVFKDIHIVLVDDSDIDCVDINILKRFPYIIDFVKINRNAKFWINPCVNYNLAFKYIKGDKIILQNSEVCHVGDIFTYVNTHINNDDEYHVFDVKASANYPMNNYLYDIHDPLEIDIFNFDLFSQWYQHTKHSNRQLHFLVSFTRATFEKFKGFSYDYAFSADYDDDDLLLRIKSKNIKIISVDNEIHKVGGIHLYHTLSVLAWTNRTSNESIFQKKKAYFEKYNESYLEISDGVTIDEKIQYLYKLYQT